MRKRWRLHPHDQALVAALQAGAGVSPVVAQLLITRGVTQADAARSFLEVRLKDLRDPESLPGMSAAADLIHQAIAEGRRIVVYGDYDADGMTGTAILLNCLKLLGATASYFVPNRITDGYGLSSEAIERLASQGAEVIISVDCGVASVEEAALARRLGLQLVITDHHEAGESLPDAAAIVHPRLPGSEYPFGGLCGAGVAFKLAWALSQRASQAKKVSEPMRNFLMDALGLAALGAVADVVPLLDENRILVKHGLFRLRDHPSLGLAKLIEVVRLHEKSAISSEDVAFSLAPRLNAAGRLGQASLAVELLTTQSPDRAEALAQYIHQLNEDRGTLERRIQRAATEQAKEQFDPQRDPALVLAGNDWHPGVIGIVAGRLAEKFHRPTILLALDPMGLKPATGSARSAGGLDLYRALSACSEHLVSFGGHAAAAGVKIQESQIDAFRAAFCEQVAASVSEEDRVAEIFIDAEAPLCQLSHQVIKQIEQLAPFGEANPRPVLCATGVRLAEPPRRIGGGERHLSLRLVQHGVKMRAVAFGMGESAEELAACPEIDIAYRPVLNEFRGRQTVETQLVDWRPSDASNEERNQA